MTNTNNITQVLEIQSYYIKIYSQNITLTNIINKKITKTLVIEL